MTITASPAEMSRAHQWSAAAFAGEHPALPFSFNYAGRPSAEFLATWPREIESGRIDDRRTTRTLTYRDPESGVCLRCEVVEYADFPTVEWTLYLRNDGPAATPILSQILPLDITLEPPVQDEYILHHATGSPCAISDFQPWESSWSHWSGQRVLAPSLRIASYGGRPSDSALPYFNIEGRGDGPAEGLIVVVGWPGQWSAEFTRRADRALCVVAGQELTHFTLYPGEEVRTPLIVLQFWQGDYLRSQNIWRRWMLAHNLPRPGGVLPPPQAVSSSSTVFTEMMDANEENQKLFIDRLIEEGLQPDYWWMDAGWYPTNGHWWNTGTWEPDPARFPNGLRAVSDHAHSRGVKTIVWFEPERVTPGTWLYEQHPEWLLPPPEGRSSNNYLLDLGNPAARAWAIEHFDRLISEQGVDVYRQDFNMDPIDQWRAHDAGLGPTEHDRQGITEINYVTGYLAYWDELRRRHPGMLLDTCASGGRRDDLETLRRSVPLHRSDYTHQAVGNQCHTYGLSFWVPYYGTGAPHIDPYILRSTFCPSYGYGNDMRKPDLDYALLRRMLGEWRQIAPDLLGDYYPLTSYSYAEDVWMAWQFDRPEAGSGVVQVFRRSASPHETAQLRLHGLDPDARYTLTNFDEAVACEKSGRELMEQGLRVVILQRPAAVTIRYQLAGASAAGKMKEVAR
jgi:alpha-galactosidase